MCIRDSFQSTFQVLHSESQSLGGVTGVTCNAHNTSDVWESGHLEELHKTSEVLQALHVTPVTPPRDWLSECNTLKVLWKLGHLEELHKTSEVLQVLHVTPVTPPKDWLSECNTSKDWLSEPTLDPILAKTKLNLEKIITPSWSGGKNELFERF